MPKYRKKPVVIEAVRWKPDPAFARWPRRGKYQNIRVGVGQEGVEYCVTECGIRTLEGFMQLRPGDWIITGVQGERYPIKPDIFKQTYEAMNNAENAEVGIGPSDMLAAPADEPFLRANTGARRE
jgi:hypothetical protein